MRHVSFPCNTIRIIQIIQSKLIHSIIGIISSFDRPSSLRKPHKEYNPYIFYRASLQGNQFQQKTTMQSPLFADKHAIADAMTGDDVAIAESYSEESSGRFTPVSQGSQELRGRVPVSFGGQTRSAEKVLDKSRRCKRVEGVPHVGTDDTEEVPPELGARIKESAILLKFFCQNVVTKEIHPYSGQAALVRNPQNGAVMFVTCKHNTGAEANKKGELEVCLDPHECMLQDNSAADIHLPDTGWRKMPSHAVKLRDGATWSNGFDLSLGPTIHADSAEEHWPNDPWRKEFLEDLLQKIRPFEVVGDGFSSDVGLKIGIVVFNPYAEKEEAFSEVNGLADIDVDESYANVTKGITEAKIEAVLGEKDSVMIYTGCITFDGNQHIEYNVNTYNGCSGAIVIVMDRGHPDFGKALAVHAGYKDVLDKNVGFKLVGAFDAFDG